MAMLTVWNSNLRGKNNDNDDVDVDDDDDDKTEKNLRWHMLREHAATRYIDANCTAMLLPSHRSSGNFF